MSYSLHVRAATKLAAIAALAAKFEADVVAHQPSHETDKAAIMGNAQACVDQLKDDEAKDVVININGHISYKHVEPVEGVEPAPLELSVCSINCSASLSDRIVPTEAGVSSEDHGS